MSLSTKTSLQLLAISLLDSMPLHLSLVQISFLEYENKKVLINCKTVSVGLGIIPAGVDPRSRARISGTVGWSPEPDICQEGGWFTV